MKRFQLEVITHRRCYMTKFHQKASVGLLIKEINVDKGFPLSNGVKIFF